jgi:hypothetical protein
MYKNKYIKYKAKYLQLSNNIYIGGENNEFNENLIKYLKKEVEKVSSKNISQDRWAIIRLQTILKILYHPIPLQITTNFYDEWIRINYSNQYQLYLDKMKMFEGLIKNTDFLDTLDKKNYSKLREEIIDSLSYMNYYGNKTYFTIGSFMHVVGTKFYYSKESDEDKILYLTEGQLIHSMIENLANFLYKFDRKTNFIKSIIYFERFINAYKLLKAKQGDPLSQESDKLFQLIDEIKSILDNGYKFLKAKQGDTLSQESEKKFKLMDEMKSILDKTSKKSLKHFNVENFHIENFNIENFKEALEIISPKKYINRTCDFDFYISIMVQLLMSVCNNSNSNIEITFVDDKFLFTLNT